MLCHQTSELVLSIVKIPGNVSEDNYSWCTFDAMGKVPRGMPVFHVSVPVLLQFRLSAKEPARRLRGMADALGFQASGLSLI